MTTPELHDDDLLDDRLREHYAAFRRDHAPLRERLLADIESESPNRSSRPAPTLFNRRLLMRLSAAAIVSLAIGAAVFLINPGPGGTTWAEVVKAMGPIESVQYRTSGQGMRDGNEVNAITVNDVTSTAMRVDTFLGNYLSVMPDMNAEHPSTRVVIRRDGNEVTRYETRWRDGRVQAVSQKVDYLSVTCPKEASAQYNAMLPIDQTLDMWRALHKLAPESVLKRGSQEVDGKRMLRFEIIAGGAPGTSLVFGPGTYLLVDPKTRQPVMLNTGNQEWSHLRFNEPVSAERFGAPEVPDDLDAAVSWSFTILADAWAKPEFTFRVLDPAGEPIVTKSDVVIRQLATPGFGMAGEADMMVDPGFGGAAAVPGQPAGPSPEGAPAVVTSTGGLSRAGIDKLDRFMARNPGAEMTIEITGDAPIKRRVFGRLARESAGMSRGVADAVWFVLPSAADLKAATQPASPGAEFGGEMGAGGFTPGGGRPGGLAPGRDR